MAERKRYSVKLIIAGSRDLNLDNAYEAIEKFFLEQGSTIPKVMEVVSGTARGVDQLGEHWANKYRVKISRFPADWNLHGKPAGHIRNKQMADYADALLLIWNGESKGSANMKQNMQRLNKPIYEVIIK